MSHTPFLHKLANHILSQYDLNNQELTVVFPNQRAATYLRKAFGSISQQTLWLPQIISIQEAVTQWSGYELADNIDLLFELIDIDAQLHVEQNSDLNVFGSQAAQMAKDFDEIDQYAVDAKYIFSYITEKQRLEYWNFDEEKSKEKELKYLSFFTSLYQYYFRLRERLAKKGKGYYGMITRYLSELTEAQLLEKIGDKRLVFAGFNAMTTTEERIVDTLIKNGKAEIFFDYDSYYIDDINNEAGFFARHHKKRHPEWLKDGISDHLRNEEKNIHLVKVNGNALQAKALQSKLEETDNDKQAIVLADEHLLIPTLNAIPNTETYKDFKVSMGYPLDKTPVNQLVKACFTLWRRNRISRTITENGKQRFAEGMYIWPILQLLDHEIIKTALPRHEVSAFSRWKNKSVSDGKFIFEDTDIETLSQMPNIQEFLKIVLPKASFMSPADVLQSISGLLAFLASVMQSQGKTKETVFLLNQISEIGKIIAKLQQVIISNSKYINDLQDVETLYRLLTSGESLKLKSSNTEGLQIMGLLETRNLDFKQLHLLSINEGIMPPDKSQGSFIPHFIRRVCGLPSYAESQAVVAYHFYRLLQNSEHIYLYYNTLDETSGGEASRFILQIKHELAKNANIHIHEESFGCITEPSIAVIKLSAEKNDATLERLHYLLESPQKGLSPSSLSTYLNCPLKYYMHYIAQIDDDSVQEDVGFNVIGTVIHDTLEFLFADYLPVDEKQQVIDKALFDKKIMPSWEQKLTLSIEKNMPNGLPDVGFNYLNRITIEQQLKNYLQYTSNQLKDNDLIILQTEGKLTATLPAPFEKCRFAGRTDRIDRFGGTIRVIDYKTGRVSNADLKVPVRHKENDLDYLKMIPDKALQLLLYKYMYLKENPTCLPEQVIGAIHGLKYAHSIEFGLTMEKPKNDDTEANSDFLGDDSFIRDMEAMLKAVVAEILDTKTPFVQTNDNKKCNYCDFKLICRR